MQIELVLESTIMTSDRLWDKGTARTNVDERGYWNWGEVIIMVILRLSEEVTETEIELD